MAQFKNRQENSNFKLYHFWGSLQQQHTQD